MPELEPLRLSARDRVFELGSVPLLMGILNVTPDSFSDGGAWTDADAAFARGRELLDSGADIIDVGGESGVTNAAAISAREEVRRVRPVIERLTGELDATVSIDTFKASVAREAIAAGAAMVNDPSGLSDPAVAHVCAETGAALVITHTRARPKHKLEAPRYADVIEDVKRFLRGRLRLAASVGVRDEQVVLCPGPDLGKDPAQTIELLQGLADLHDLGRPLLLAVSRKDFVGALLDRPPRERLAGTLAAVQHGVSLGAQLIRVHDVAEARDFLTVSAALDGTATVPPTLRLADGLRRENGSGDAGRAKGSLYEPEIA